MLLVTLIYLLSGVRVEARDVKVRLNGKWRIMGSA